MAYTQLHRTILADDYFLNLNKAEKLFFIYPISNE